MIIDLQKHYQETEIYLPGELSSKIIKSMLEEGSVTLRTKESRCAGSCGLYNLLDELCQYWHWDSKKITIETTNYIEHNDKYNIVFIVHDPLSETIDSVIESVKSPSWNHEKIYGMFIGRFNATRLKGVHEHLNFKYRDQGLTSFHQDLSYYYDRYSMLEYLTSTNQTYQDAVNVKPYSDIDQLLPVPIVEPQNILGWESVYEKIGIELVFQTNPVETSVGFTEKLVRPILYKRPFLTVAGRNYNKNINKSFINLPTPDDPELKDLYDHLRYEFKPLRFFDDLIKVDYDLGEGVYRVQHVFDILKQIIDRGDIHQILDICHEDIEHNYNSIIDLCHTLSAITRRNKLYFNFSEWNKRA